MCDRPTAAAVSIQDSTRLALRKGRWRNSSIPYPRSSTVTFDLVSTTSILEHMEKNQDIKLTSFLRAKAREAEQAIRYRPSFFLGMLENDGGYRTVIKLLSANGVSDGFKKLWEHGRMDLSVEALVVESEWRSAFDPVLIARAEKRLNEVAYRFTRFTAS